ncbi:MAG: hypothetical protein V7672_00405 [Brevundimonas sp.]|uniref:hypothetical protein n=1 Tax=Brevundimonas sp. TaxID=1871086 RepID=UPI0030020593
MKDATLAPPAAGEVADYMDEGDALDGDEVHMGRTRNNVAAHSRSDEPGPKTQAAIDRKHNGG